MVYRPAADNVRKVAIVSIYMNNQPYNIKNPRGDEGKEILGSLLQATGKVAMSKMTDKEKELLDQYNPERTTIISYALSSYVKELSSVNGWQLVPVDQVVQNDFYKKLTLQPVTPSKTRQFLGKVAEEFDQVRWTTPPGFLLLNRDNIVNPDKAQELDPGQRKKLMDLCAALKVDAVAIIELDLGYRYNKIGKLTIFGTTMAVPSVSSSLLVVTRNGEVAVNNGPIQKGGGDRYDGDTVGLIKDGFVIFRHKENKVVESYNLAIANGAAGMRKELVKELAKKP
jgi:hypothetical protein